MGKSNHQQSPIIHRRPPEMILFMKLNREQEPRKERSVHNAGEHQNANRNNRYTDCRIKKTGTTTTEPTDKQGGVNRLEKPIPVE